MKIARFAEQAFKAKSELTPSQQPGTAIPGVFQFSGFR
jgi:hypothetical protein